MTTEPATDTASGWDQATLRCGQCGAEYTVTTEAAYLQAVGVHRDAHALWDRLNPIERDGLASILRVILPAQEFGTAFLALADRQKHLTATAYSNATTHDNQGDRDEEVPSAVDEPL